MKLKSKIEEEIYFDINDYSNTCKCPLNPNVIIIVQLYVWFQFEHLNFDSVVLVHLYPFNTTNTHKGDPLESRICSYVVINNTLYCTLSFYGSGWILDFQNEIKELETIWIFNNFTPNMKSGNNNFIVLVLFPKNCIHIKIQYTKHISKMEVYFW